MPTPTYTPLANATVAIAAVSVTFSNIPATYRDLVMVFNGSTTISDGVGSRYNGDTGANYSAVRMTGSAAGAISDNFTGVTRILETAGDTSERTVYISNIMDYSATDKHKTVINRANIPSNATAIAARWANTAAVNSITVFSPGSTISAGSTISLYGVIA
jgi:hypothetical protein